MILRSAAQTPPGNLGPAGRQTGDLWQITKYRVATQAAAHRFLQVSELIKAESAPRLPLRKRAAHRLSVRIMLLTWVELWGFEPQTSCMPCAVGQSASVWPSRTGSLPPARTVCGSPAPSEQAAPRWLPKLAPRLPWPVIGGSSQPGPARWQTAE